MKSKTSPKRRIYIVFSILLIIISFCLLLKPCLRLFFPLKHEDYIIKCAEEKDIDKYTIMAVISVESGFDSGAQSVKGAKGLMQITDKTALWISKNFDVDYSTSKADTINISMGCTYLKYLLDKYEGNLETALCAYNAGEGNVAKWLEGNKKGDYNLKDIPFKETKDYIKKFKQREKIYKFLY